MDVLLLQSGQDIEEEMEQLKLSQSYRLGEWAQSQFPAYDNKNCGIKVQAVSKSAVLPTSPPPVRITLPERSRKNAPQKRESLTVKITLPERSRKNAPQKRESLTVKITPPEQDKKNASQDGQLLSERITPPEQHRKNAPRMGAASEKVMLSDQRTEKTYEELASLASSVVLVGVHDNRGTLIGTGSGIMIGRRGYILTNNHVASGGCFYTVRIEEDDRVYKTEEVIKYNSVLDLAVLRIDRTLQPLPVYGGRQKLARGQRVVAIGSPLGLFNSVSDGIISGFRVIDDVDMIQFTAPISHGSSGGALLNMYGEVIGISTAGIDEGQNINLAIGYEGINLFIQGFTG
ncbi:serine protease [Lachnospiraceae bacterium]|nr:serine protease [Lachnospiraceae bacterium]